MNEAALLEKVHREALTIDGIFHYAACRGGTLVEEGIEWN